MASPFRSCSPVTERHKPAALNGGFPGQATSNASTLRKGFSINVAPKAPPGISKTNNTVTPANSPSDYPHRVSPFMEPNASPRHFEETKENAGEAARPSAKSVSGRSPTLPKGMKSFMAPTFSAASKATSPRKRILSERNEAAASAAAAVQSPAKNSISSPIAGPKFTATEISDCVRSLTIQDGPELTKESSIDYMEVDQIQPISKPNNKPHGISEAEVLSDFGTGSSEFLAAFPDPGEDVVQPSFMHCQGSPADVGFTEEQHSLDLPPYDPKRNYLSPRPQFLRYRPNRRLEDIFPTGNEANAEEEQGFGDHDLGKSELSAEHEIKAETKELCFLEQPTAAVNMSTQMRHGEIQEVDDGKRSDEETVSAESSIVEEKLWNANSRQLDSKVVEEVEEDGATDDDEEVQEKPSGWIKRSVLVVCLLALVSISVISNGSPGLIPSLENKALAAAAAAGRSGMFYTSAIQAINGIEAFWRNDAIEGWKLKFSEKAMKIAKLDFPLKDVTGFKFGMIVNDMKAWLYACASKLKMLTKSAANELNMEVSSVPLGLLTDAEQDINGHILFPDLIKSSTKGKGSQTSEEYGQSEENGIPLSEYPTRQSARIVDADEQHWQKVSEPLPSELQEEDTAVLVVDETLQEARASFEADNEDEVSKMILVPEATQIINENAPGAQNQPAAEVSESILVSEAIQSIDENASDAENQSEVFEKILVSNSEEMSVLMYTDDSQLNEAPIALPLPRGNAGLELFEGDRETADMERTAFETRSIEGDASIVSQQEINSGSVATDFTESASSHFDEDIAEDPASPAADVLKGSEAHISTIPRRSGRELLLTGASVGASILAAVAIAVVCFASASKRIRKSSEEVNPRRDPKETTDYFSPLDTTEKKHSRMQSPSSWRQKDHLLHPRTSPPRIELLGEYFPAQMSTSDKNASGTSTRVDAVQVYERRSQRRTSMSSASQQEYTPSHQDYSLASDFSADSPSYGSFTTYETFVKKEPTEDEDQKVLRLTPVRRSSRIRRQAMSP